MSQGGAGICSLESGLSSSSRAQTVTTLSACKAGDSSSIPGVGRCPGEGSGNPLQYSCLGNPRDRGAWRATVHDCKESDTTKQLTLDPGVLRPSLNIKFYIYKIKKMTPAPASQPLWGHWTDPWGGWRAPMKPGRRECVSGGAGVTRSLNRSWNLHTWKVYSVILVLNLETKEIPSTWKQVLPMWKNMSAFFTNHLSPQV